MESANTYLEDQDINACKKRRLLAQWPRDPNLICCDYNAAERATQLGLLGKGKKENGGALLWLECLGVEYRDELVQTGVGLLGR